MSTSMALSQVHTSTKAQQSPFIHPIPIHNQTCSYVTIILQNVTVAWHTTCFHLNPIPT